MNFTEEELKNEEWRDVPGYEGLYQVSDLGNFKSLERIIKHWKGGNSIKKEKILKGNINNAGYKCVLLLKESKSKQIRIHQLVAIAFLGHIPDGMNICVDHQNGIKTDNRLINLKLMSHRENCSKDKKGYSSKYIGVSWYKKRSRWISKIRINKKYICLGYFENEEEASEYYQNALVCINENRIEDIIIKRK